MDDNKKKDEELEKLYGSNKGSGFSNEEDDEINISFEEDEFDEHEDEEENQSEVEDAQNHNFTPEEQMIRHAQESLMRYYEDSEKKKKSRFLIVLIVGILAVISFFVTGMLVGIFVKQIKAPTPNPIIEEKPSANQAIIDRYRLLDEIEEILGSEYYKELSRDDIMSAYFYALTEITDRYTGVLIPQLTVSGSSEGGYGITIQYYSNDEKKIKGILVVNISAGSKANKDILQDPEKAILPGDIIVGYYDTEKAKTVFFDDEFTNKDITKIRVDKKEVKSRQLYIYNPLRNGEIDSKNFDTTLPTVNMVWEAYTGHDPVEYLEFNSGEKINNNETTLTKNIAYLRIKQFDDDIVVPTGEKLTRIDEFLIKKETNTPTGELIIDLRGNPGGRLDSLSSLLAYFIPADYEVTDSNGKKVAAPLFVMAPNAVKKETNPDLYNDSQNYTYRSNGIYRREIDKVRLDYKQTKEFKKYPIKILVDENSASASEVFAAVMKEHADAIIVGSETFGKDLYQVTETLKSEPLISVRFTAGKWGYYKKNESDVLKYSIITNIGSEIITKDSSNYIPSVDTYFESVKPVINEILKKDTVSSDTINLSKFLQRVILDNLDDITFNAKYGASKTSLEKNEFLRTDGYFDSKIEEALIDVKTFLGIISNDADEFKKTNEYNHQTYAHFYKYYLKNAIMYNILDSLIVEKALDEGKDTQLIKALLK